jgi:hypothetical protein
LASTSSQRVSPQARASGNAGPPPPLPRSTAAVGGVPSHACRKPSAWLRWGSTAPGPRNPSSRASSRTARSCPVGEWPLRLGRA